MKSEFLQKLLEGKKVEWRQLGEVCEVKAGETINKNFINQNAGSYAVINSGREPLGFVNKYNTENDPIGITSRGAGVGSITWQKGRYFRGNLNYSCTIKDSNQLLKRYLYHLLNCMQKEIQSLCTYQGIPALNSSNLINLTIPIPPISVQGEVVRILDLLTSHTTELNKELNKELTARKKQYEYYRNKLLTFKEGEAEWRQLGEVFNIFAGGDLPLYFSKQKQDNFTIPILSNGIDEKSLYGWTDIAKVIEPSLTISARGTIGWTSIQEKPFYPIVRLLVLTPKMEIKVNLKYLYYYMKMIENDYNVTKSGIPQLTKPMINKIQIPIPPLSKQKEIVAILDKFDALTNSITEGLPKEIELRQKQYEYYRDLLLNFSQYENK